MYTVTLQTNFIYDGTSQHVRLSIFLHRVVAPSNLIFAQGTGERGQTSKPDNPAKGARPVVKNGKVVGWTVPNNQTGKRIPKSLEWGRSVGLNDLDPKWVAMGAATGLGAMTIWEILEGLNVLNEVGP